MITGTVGKVDVSKSITPYSDVAAATLEALRKDLEPFIAAPGAAGLHARLTIALSEAWLKEVYAAVDRGEPPDGVLAEACRCLGEALGSVISNGFHFGLSQDFLWRAFIDGLSTAAGGPGAKMCGANGVGAPREPGRG